MRETFRYGKNYLRHIALRRLKWYVVATQHMSLHSVDIHVNFHYILLPITLVVVTRNLHRD
jgi:hypothetical protein